MAGIKIFLMQFTYSKRWFIQESIDVYAKMLQKYLCTINITSFPAHHDKIFKSLLSFMNFPIKLSALLQRKTRMQIYHFYLTSKLLQTSPIMWLFVRIDWNNVWQELGCVLQYCIKWSNISYFSNITLNFSLKFKVIRKNV